MSEYKLEMIHYRHLVTRKVDGEEVYNEIKMHLNKGDVVIVDFNGIDTMTTYFAKQVFGKLYTELGAEKFSEAIKFDKSRMTEDVELVLKIGIAGALSSL